MLQNDDTAELRKAEETGCPYDWAKAFMSNPITKKNISTEISESYMVLWFKYAMRSAMRITEAKPRYVGEPSSSKSADQILLTGSETLAQRGQGYDKNQERSMGSIVKMFNEMTGHDLTTEQGWKFMVILKLVRSEHGINPDNYVDGASYFALAGEENGKQND